MLALIEEEIEYDLFINLSHRELGAMRQGDSLCLKVIEKFLDQIPYFWFGVSNGSVYLQDLKVLPK